MSIISDAEARDFLGIDSDDAILPYIRRPIEKAVKAFLRWNPERHTVTKYYPKGQVGGEYSNWPGENVAGGEETWPKRGSGIVNTVGGLSTVLQLDDKFVIPSGLTVYETAGAYMGQVSSSWTLLTLGTHYWLDLDDANFCETGHLVRLNASWPKQPGSVKVTYSAGFTAAQLAGTDSDYDASDIRLATFIAVQKAYNEIKTNRPNTSTGRAAGPIVSETIDGYSYTLAQSSAVAQFGFAQALPLASKKLLQRYRSYRLTA